MSSAIWDAQSALHDVYTDTQKILVMYNVLHGVTGKYISLLPLFIRF